MAVITDFIFKDAMALRYFSQENARKTSNTYYQLLFGEIRNGGQAVENIVRASMIESIEIWGQMAEAEVRRQRTEVSPAAGLKSGQFDLK